MTNNGDEAEPRIARLERSDELDWSSTARVLDLMDRHVANWQKRQDSLRREREKECRAKQCRRRAMQRENTGDQREYSAMRLELDEFRDELRSIRDERRRRDDWNR